MQIDDGSWLNATVDAALKTWLITNETLTSSGSKIHVRTIDLAGNVTGGNGHSYVLDQTAPTPYRETIYSDDSNGFVIRSAWLLKNDDPSSYISSVSGGGSGLSFDKLSFNFTGTSNNSSFTYQITDSAGNSSNVTSSVTDTVTNLGAQSVTTNVNGGIYIIQQGGTSVLSSAGYDIISFKSAGTVSALGNGGDALDVETNVAVTATVSSSGFTADSYTNHTGTGKVTLNTAGYNVDLSLASGSNGYTINNTASTAATLKASSFGDVLSGKAGNDSFYGGAGADTFVLNNTQLSNGTDSIYQFNTGSNIDTLKISAFLASATDANLVSATSGTSALNIYGKVALINQSTIGIVDFGSGHDFADLTGSNKAVVVAYGSGTQDASVYYAYHDANGTHVDKVATLVGVGPLDTSHTHIA